MFRIITVLLIEILGGVEVDLFVPALPDLQKTFGLTHWETLLLVSVNLIAYCLCCLFAGALGDRFNRRHIILGSLLIFVLGSILCVVTPSFPILLTGRLLQGVGIAGPTVLAYVIIVDEYPIEQQMAFLGIMNGISTISMAFAPTLGCYIDFYFDWHGNFVALLLLGIVCLVAAYFALPNRKGNKAVSLTLEAYKPLVQSKVFLYYTAAIALLVVPYWVFTGIAPILYRGDFGVPLELFGFYQGVLATSYAGLSLLSGKIIGWFGIRRCLVGSIRVCLVSVFGLAILVIGQINSPLWITMFMALLSAGMVFPCNILFPLSINVLEDTKGRATAIIMASRLALTGITLLIIGRFYDHTFFLTGILIIGFVLLALFFIQQLMVKQWIKL